MFMLCLLIGTPVYEAVSLVRFKAENFSAPRVSKKVHVHVKHNTYIILVLYNFVKTRVHDAAPFH